METMYIFEVTKCCGSSSFVPMYKSESLLNLYERVVHHFSIEIKELFFYTVQGQRIKIPLSNKTIEQYMIETTNLVPVYFYPLPKVYKIYIEYEHYNNCEDCTLDV